MKLLSGIFTKICQNTD